MTELITMTPEERAEFEAFRAEKERKRQEAERNQLLKDYRTLVDDTTIEAVNKLKALAIEMERLKDEIFADFDTAISIKREDLGSLKDGQLSNTFTNSDSTHKIVLGYYTLDTWMDTAEDGIELIKESLQSLATDENSRLLLDEVLRLISRDAMGNLDAKKVLRLQALGQKIDSEDFARGINLILEAYRPVRSKTYLRAYERTEKTGEWKTIPLSLTSIK